MKSNERYRFSLLLIVLGFMLSGFDFPDILKKNAPGGGFPPLVAKLPSPVIDRLVGVVYNIKLSSARKANQLDVDQDLLEQITRVFAHLKKSAEQSKTYREIAKHVKWEIHLVDNDEENAFAWPGGKILVYKGILPFAEDEAGLAALLGHEMVHALNRHAEARINDNLKRAGGLGALLANPNFKDLDPKTKNAVLVGLGIDAVGSDLAFSREKEHEADYGGLLLAAEAGYDPKKALGFWRRLVIRKKETGFTYLKTHPSNKARLDALNQKKPDFLQAYENAEGKQPSRRLVHVASE